MGIYQARDFVILVSIVREIFKIVMGFHETRKMIGRVREEREDRHSVGWSIGGKREH